MLFLDIKDKGVNRDAGFRGDGKQGLVIKPNACAGSIAGDDGLSQINILAHNGVGEHANGRLDHNCADKRFNFADSRLSCCAEGHNQGKADQNPF